MYIRRAYKLLESHKYNTTANPKCMGLLKVVRKQHSLSVITLPYHTGMKITCA